MFEPPAGALGTVVLNSATAVPQTYYAVFAEYLSAHGWRVLTYDYRGIGGSRPATLRGFDATMTSWAELDMRAALAWARANPAGNRLVALGHSFGGQAIGLIDELGEVDASINVASQLGYYGHWPTPSRYGYGFLWHVGIPALTSIFGYSPGSMGLGGTDLPAGVARQWARWCRNPRYFLDEEPAAEQRFKRYDRPTQFWSFHDDPYAPRRAVRAMVRMLANANVEHRRVKPADIDVSAIGHFGFFRPQVGSKLWPEVVSFLDDVRLGKAARRAQASCGVTIEDIESDLRYGQI